MQTRTMLVCAGLLACACAPVADDGSPSALVPPVITSCQSYAITRCERMNTCSGGVLVARTYGSMAACEAHLSDTCALWSSAPGANATPRTIDRCTAAVSGASCAVLLGGSIASCHPERGSLADGAPCSFALQCQSSRCDVAVGAGCGVCGPSPARIPCGDTGCDAPAVCVFGHCAIPIEDSAAAEAQPSVEAHVVRHDGLMTRSFTPPATVIPGSMQPVAELPACDYDRGCGLGFDCMSFRVPSVTDPRVTLPRFECVPMAPATPLACALAGLLRNPGTGACMPAIVESDGAACGASHPTVVCGESGRCVREHGERDGVCVAASAEGDTCFADRSRGPGCMPPAYCRRSAGQATGICERPNPALCGG